MTTPTADTTCEVCTSLRNEEAKTVAANAAIKHHVVNENQIVRALKDTEDQVADRITAFAGSMRFVYLHSAWFLVWIAANVGALGASLVFDGFPFGLLTMIVSLEAIFLSTFVMISQNRQSARADVRAQLDFETNLRSEIWSVHIGQKLGVDPRHVEGAIELAMKAARQ
jgi:uncharacterized membrane protein